MKLYVLHAFEQRRVGETIFFPWQRKSWITVSLAGRRNSKFLSYAKQYNNQVRMFFDFNKQIQQKLVKCFPCATLNVLMGAADSTLLV